MWIAPFILYNGKKPNSRHNLKQSEKAYFHCGPQPENLFKSHNYLWQEMVLLKIVIIVTLLMLVIMIKIMNKRMSTNSCSNNNDNNNINSNRNKPVVQTPIT